MEMFTIFVVLTLNYLATDAYIRVERAANCPKFTDFAGRVKYRRKGTRAVFRCPKKFDRYGSKFSTCQSDGTWSNDAPLCIKTGCVPLDPSQVTNLDMEVVNGALVKFSCLDKYLLIGETLAYCNGKDWSAPLPKCAAPHELTECDFEEDLCGWVQDDNEEQDWIRNVGPTQTGNTGPKHDHTLGDTGNGHYLYFETSNPTMPGHKANLLSPMYTEDLSPMCFDFWYHILGPDEDGHVGTLEVFVLDESQFIDDDDIQPLFVKKGNQGDQWHRGEIFIDNQAEPYQIAIVATRALSYISDIAIDDVRLYNCTQSTTSPPEPTSTSASTTTTTTTTTKTITPKTTITTKKTVTSSPSTVMTETIKTTKSPTTTTVETETVTEFQGTTTRKTTITNSPTTTEKKPTSSKLSSSTVKISPAVTSEQAKSSTQSTVKTSQTMPKSSPKPTIQTSILTETTLKTSRWTQPKTSASATTQTTEKAQTSKSKTSKPSTTTGKPTIVTSTTSSTTGTTSTTKTPVTSQPTTKASVTTTSETSTSSSSSSKSSIKSSVQSGKPTTVSTTTITTSEKTTKSPIKTHASERVTTSSATSGTVSTHFSSSTSSSSFTSTTTSSTHSSSYSSSTSSSSITRKPSTGSKTEETKPKTTTPSFKTSDFTDSQTTVKVDSKETSKTVKPTKRTNEITTKSQEANNTTKDNSISVSEGRSQHPEDDTLKPLMIGLCVGIVAGLIIIGVIAYVCVRRRKFYTSRYEDELKPITNSASVQSLNNGNYYQDEEYESES